LVLPDAVADCALSAVHGEALVSCWDGFLYLLAGDGTWKVKRRAGGPARMAWSGDGAYAVAGTADGRVLRVGRDGAVAWTRAIPETKIAAPTKPPGEVVPGMPVFQGGRVPGGEHAYVGDIWMIRTGAKAVFVDAGGTSGFSTTQARLRALGIGQV